MHNQRMKIAAEGLFAAHLNLPAVSASLGQGVLPSSLSFRSQAPPGAETGTIYPAELMALANFGQFVRQARGPMSLRSLADATGLKPATLRSIELSTYRVTFETADQTYRGLGGQALYLAFFREHLLAPEARLPVFLADPSDYQKPVGALLRELREKREPRLTQRALAALLEIAPSQVSEFESGNKPPLPDTIARYFGVGRNVTVAFCGIQAE